MVGRRRRRRASTSSVETIQETDIAWRKESSVVRSIGKDVSADDWPIFELKDAVVLSANGENIENALLAGYRGPFLVRGQLIIEDRAQQSHLIMKVRGSIPIEIRKSAIYSIGEAEDGRPLIWVSGAGGWYEINPSASYKRMYTTICEAITMYYTVVDIYEKSRPRKGKKSKPQATMDELGQVFQKYASRTGDGSTFDEVLQRAQKHAPFFFDQFRQQSDVSAGWESTAFYQWLAAKFPELQATLSDPTANPLPLLGPTVIELPGEGPEAEAAPIITEDTEAAQDLPPVRPGKRRRQPRARASPKSDSGADEAMEDVDDGVSLYKISAEDNAGGEPTLFDAVVQGIDKCFDELSSSRKGLTLSNTLNKLYFDFRFPSYKGGASEIYNAPSHKVPPQEFLHYYSQALLEALDKKYKPTEFYASLKELAKMPLRPAAFKLSDFPLPLIPRKSMPRVSKKTEQVPSTPVTGRDSDASESGIRPRGKRPMRPGKTSALRPKTAASKKRPRSELESGSDTESSSNMRSQFFSGDEDSSMADAAALETEEATEPKTGVQYDLEPIKLVIRAEKAPDSSPRGPHDTWTCNQDGCDYVVRGGDEAECQTRIQAHFHDHEEQQDRVTLAVAESRGHMPINHLLEKLKQMGEQSAQERSQTSAATTEPIKRKVIA